MQQNPVISMRNVETFYGPVMALKGISIDVFEGDMVTILGGNGAGKTTILKTLSGALLPRKGNIEFYGQDITGWLPEKVALQGMGHVPEGREVFPLLSVRENLDMGAFTQTDKGQIAANLDMVFDYFPDLKNKSKDKAAYLSGGQQQMLAVGRALMMNPKTLLLDEPSLGLSPLLTKEIFAILKQLNKQQNITMLVVEQNANIALQAADFGYVIEVGRVVFKGNQEKLLASDDIQEFYLGKSKADESERGKRRWKQRKTWR